VWERARKENPYFFAVDKNPRNQERVFLLIWQMSSIQPITETLLPDNVQKDKSNDDIASDSSCLREVFKTRDTRKMGKTARCLTLFHNLTIMIALLLTLFQYYEAASISLVASMVALFRVQQEEDENFENEDLCVAEVQQTSRLTSPRRKRRKKRKEKQKPNCKDELTIDPGRLSFPTHITPGVSIPAATVKDPVLPDAVLESPTSLCETPPDKPIAKIEETVASHVTEPPNPPEDASAKSGAVETVEGFLEDTLTEVFDDEVAKFRARLETIHSNAERPKIKISGGVFAKQLAAKKSAARRKRSNNRTGTSFSI